MDLNQALIERAQHVIPGGVNSPVRAFGSVGGAPRFIERAKGPYMWDVTDKRFTDYVCSWGPMILGHNDPEVVLPAGIPAATASSSLRAVTTVIPMHFW